MNVSIAVGVRHQLKVNGTPQQQEERNVRRLAESILQVGATREVQAEPVVG